MPKNLPHRPPLTSPTLRSTSWTASTMRWPVLSGPVMPKPSRRSSSRSTASSTKRAAGSSWPGSCLMPRAIWAQVFAADPRWGADAVNSHRQLIAALRRRDTAAVIEHTVWQFTDGARRLTEALAETEVFG
ncbi:hypothetical protein BN9982_440030 [Mycobacterium tuberculosis]|nr:hypothetical protein BN9982_440030 [Mycobacterium tuberculosis]